MPEDTNIMVHETDQSSDFPFEADDETVAAFYAFVRDNGLEIDDDAAVAWWDECGPWFDPYLCFEGEKT